MSKKLYVGNLPWSMSDDDLKKAFEPMGTVTSASIIKDRATGRSKGFGFVEMENDADADNAISQMHNSEIEGRKIIVNEARPMTERPPRRFEDRRDRF